jgi:hypothetical protein
MTCFNSKLPRSRAALLLAALRQILPWQGRLWVLLKIRLPLVACLLMLLWQIRLRAWILRQQRKWTHLWVFHQTLLWEDFLLELAIWVMPLLQLIPWLILLLWALQEKNN